jgi:hypothetical protein
MTWRDIETAPEEGREIECWNPVTGVYRTKRGGDEYPFRNWIYEGSIHYPRPRKWRYVGQEKLRKSADSAIK